MNLIEDRWIPVRRQNGEEVQIAPWELTSDFDENPIVALAAPRPDFQGGLIQFLIGLIQTTTPPDEENDFEWEDWFEDPPDPETLRAAFAPYIDCFYLDGDGPRFMQDLELGKEVESGEVKKNEVPIGSLLIDSPGENTLKNNADHFIKREGIQGICYSCASTALFTLQTNAPAGGQGHRTSLRGGGPLTSLIVVDPKGSGIEVETLWHNLWPNILYKDSVGTTTNENDVELDSIFPWLSPTRVSDPEMGKITYPTDVHVLQMYWGMPRRIRLSIEDVRGGVCSICSQDASALVRHYITRAYGINYSEEWQHHLSPYYKDKNGKPFPHHPQPGGFTYKHWVGISEGLDSDIPAKVVTEFTKKHIQKGVEQFRLWTFGYDMDNMKPRNWYEATYPLYLFFDQNIRRNFSTRVQTMVESSEMVTKLVQDHVKAALDLKGGLGIVSENFYQTTEINFFNSLKSLYTILPKGDDDRVILAQWYHTIKKAAEKIFDDYTLREDVAFADMKRIVKARKKMMQLLNGKKLKNLLNVPNKGKEVA